MPKKLIFLKSHKNFNNNSKQWISLIVLLAMTILIDLIIKIEGVIVLSGLIVAVIVIIHILIKLSAIFKPWSNISVEPAPDYKPFVSIHIACKSEAAELVNKTVESTTKLNYDNYEVIVIHNNNQDAHNWQKIQKYVESCGKNYKFVHIDKMPGFKAGALNYLNSHYIDKKAEIIAIVDCDYIVTPDFLNETVGYFKNPEVGIVQVPQSYYNVNSCNIGLAYEYRSFFTLVMHQAQRFNLVTFTGTMGLIRTDLIRKGLKWNEWCITEDVEAGVHINSVGFNGVYVDKSLGKGLMPFDYISLIKQRQRWTYGNMQIIKKDLVSVILNKALSIKQKFAFLALLVTWFHFELIITGIYLILNILRLFNQSIGGVVPVINLMLVLLAVSLIGSLLYFTIGMRKEASILERIKAFLVHYGLLYVMSSSWIICLLGRKLGFIVTSKEKQGSKMLLNQYSHEFIIIALLLVGLVMALLSNRLIWLDLVIILPFVAVELMGIIYLYRALAESDIKNINK